MPLLTTVSNERWRDLEKGTVLARLVRHSKQAARLDSDAGTVRGVVLGVGEVQHLDVVGIVRDSAEVGGHANYCEQRSGKEQCNK